MSEFVAEIRPGSANVVAATGELDIAGVDAFLARCREVLDSTSEVLEIDCGGIVFIDSTGIGALVRIYHEATKADREVRLTHVPDPVSRGHAITGLSDVFGDKDA
jgi:anti-anti-sigma factor